MRAMLAALAVLAIPALAQDAAPRREDPQQAFERAMRERERGDLHEAIRSFHAILDEHPGLNRARLELAVAYYHALDHRAALEHARRVLADPATPPQVRANVERLIAQIEAAAQPHRWSGFVSAGYLYDSNVSAGPASPSYEVGGSLLSLDPNAVRRSDHAWLATLGGSHLYQEGVRLWQSQALFSRLDYRHEHAYDLQVFTLTTGPAWIRPPRLRFSLPVQYDRLELGEERYLEILGLSPALVFGTPGGDELTIEAHLQERDYARSVDAGRDSDYYSFGLQAGRVIGAITVQAGARLSRDDAEAAPFDYRGRELFGLVAARAFERATAYLRVTHARNRYDEADAVAGTDRTDRETRVALGVSYRFDPWSASATYLDIRHKSDVPFYAFERRQASFTITYSF